MRVTIVYNRRRDAVAPLLIKYYKLGVATVKSAIPFPGYNFNGWITCADLVWIGVQTFTGFRAESLVGAGMRVSLITT